jgi:hypothetical protein
VKKVALMLCVILVLLLSAGCKDITDSFKPGSFGNTPEEKAMVEAITEKYGDLTKKGDPRFLEAWVTTSVDSFIPVDVVSKYSKNTEKLYAWFVYDNFDEDELEIEWVYLDDSYSIHTFKATTGTDFGRGSFILEQPDDGWVTGDYEVIIRGRGIQKTINFEIINGATVAVPLSFTNGKITLAGGTPAATEPVQSTVPATSASPTTPAVQPGWHFTRWEYIMSSVDVSLVGARQGRTSAGDGILDYSKGEGDKNNFTVSVWRTYDDGDHIASGSSVTTWTDPPEFIAEGQKPSFNVKRVTESSWGINQFNTKIDMEDINPGGATAGAISFVTPDGESYIVNYEGTFESAKGMPKGSKGSKKAIIVSIGNGYGFKYYYEWQE